MLPFSHNCKHINVQLYLLIIKTAGNNGHKSVTVLRNKLSYIVSVRSTRDGVI